MKKYEVSVMTYGELKDVIEVPRFQRSPIWSDKKKLGLIETIKSGLPIGSLLLSKKGEKYELIDGLQRFSTLKDFEAQKFKYVSDREITTDYLMNIINSDRECDDYIYAIRELDMQNSSLLSRIREIIVYSFNNGVEKDLNALSWEITGELKEKIAVLAKYRERKLQPEVYNLVININNILDVNQIELPLIIFKNNDLESRNSDLIEIFTRLNSEGVKLSKYDIFSASWQDITIRIDYDGKGKEIIDAVIEKYKQSAKKSGLEISGFDPEDLKESGNINIFEYAYAISKVISNHSKFLFTTTNESQVDSLGFVLLAGIFNIPNKEMNRLGDVIKKYSIDYVKLLNTLLDTVNRIELSLKSKVVGFNGKNYSCHSELQIASYIICWHKLKYKINKNSIEILKSYNNQIKELGSNLSMHYLYDILRGYWSGSGDSKLDELIMNPIDNRYLRKVDKTSFETQILTWLDEQNSKERISISAETKLFINYIFKNSFKESELDGISLDYDHIIPKCCIKQVFTEKGIKVPISTPCNLAYIQTFDNRSKRENTYYNLLDKRKSAFILCEKKLDKYLYPKRSELEFVESKETFNRDNYIKFLNERKKYLSNKLLESLYRY